MRELQSQNSYKTDTLKQFEGRAHQQFIQAHWAQLKGRGEFEIEKAELSEKWVEVVNFDPLNPLHAMNADLPKLSTLKKYQGVETQELAVVAVLTEIDDWFGDNGLSLPQHKMLAKRIISEYYFYNPSEIKLAIRMGLQSSLSKVYGKINPSNIMDWLAEYDQIRAGEIENKTRQNQDHYNSGLPNEEVIKMWQKVVESKQRTKVIYPSLIHYCNLTDKNYTELMNQIIEACATLMEKEDEGFKDFVTYVSRRCLVELNDKEHFDLSSVIKDIEISWQIADNFEKLEALNLEIKVEAKPNGRGFSKMFENLRTEKIE